ncbi:MAG: hypothetical protein A4E62_03036 [Syntrophorhabdus sp. PtaU1.Bin002]|nr:MAG: hypothetical protein A4E62_03036 [Syntrophorhabdus sp. PtaU1.Bin002]
MLTVIADVYHDSSKVIDKAIELVAHLAYLILRVEVGLCCEVALGDLAHGISRRPHCGSDQVCRIDAGTRAEYHGQCDEG